MTFLKQNSLCLTCGTRKGKWENFAGNYFEELAFAALYRSAGSAWVFSEKFAKYIGPSFPTHMPNRRVKPDFTNQKKVFSRRLNFMIFPHNEWWEVKAKNGTLYTSTSKNQLLGHIQALSLLHSKNIKAAGGRPRLVFMTTTEVKISSSLVNAARANRVSIMHLSAQYRILDNGNIDVGFLPYYKL